MAVLIGEATREHLPDNVRYEVAEVATIDVCPKFKSEMQPLSSK